jgi:hypothetical protein
MSPQEKAKELTDKLFNIIYDEIQEDYDDSKKVAKMCALICVDEILLSMPNSPAGSNENNAWYYWQEVKNNLQ